MTALVGRVIFKVSEENLEPEEVDTKVDEQLGLSTQRLFLASEYSEKYVRLTWHFSHSVNLIDWIGLFKLDQHNPLLYMDYKSDGICGARQGSVNWRITGAQLDAINNNSSPHNFVGGKRHGRDVSKLCFRYYDGLTGSVKACSPPLLVYTDSQISISSILCKQLPESRTPSYYAKICHSGSGSCHYRTAHSTDGQWQGLNFLFPADRSGELQFTIKEKCWAGNRVVGVANVPIVALVDQGTSKDLAFVLRPANSNLLKHFHCQIVVSCRLIPQIQQPYSETMTSLLNRTKTERRSLLSTHQKAENEFNQNLNNNNNGLVSVRPSSSTISSSSTASSSGNNNQRSPPSTVSSSQSNMSTSACSSIDCAATSSSSSGNGSLSSTSSTIASSEAANLPPGWEVRVDGSGRLVYIDHINQRTAWHPPVILENEFLQQTDQYQNNDANDESKRYICARRTVVQKSDDRKVLSENRKSRVCTKPIPETNFSPDTSRSKALKFLLRADLFTHLLNDNQEGLQLYSSSAYLKHIIAKVRKEPAKFEQFERNREMVDFLNSFADKTQPLPRGWQLARDCGINGQRLFVDHTNKKITPIDPRLPEEVRRRTRSAPPVRHKIVQISDSDILNGNATAWDIANRADEIYQILLERCPEIALRVYKKLQLISRVGELALIRFANDVDLTRAISILDHEVCRPTSKFEERVHYFYTSLQRAGYGQGPSKIRFRLKRNQLMNDAFEKILSVGAEQLRKCHMTVTFDEEDGLDYGGPSRELFFLLSRELFNPYYGLFEYSADDTYTVQISAMSKFVDNHFQWMELCGRVLGLALIHRCLVDTFFTRAFYKMLIQMPYKVEDLKSMDSQFYNSLMWVRENEITADLDLTFSTTEEVAGELNERELVADGKNVPVTESNKEEFVSLMLKWRMERGVGEQSKALLRGLYSVIDKEYLRIFDADQLELVLSGTVEVDIDDWRENTEYKGGYYDGHVVINWFWDTVYAMGNAERLKLLQFVTGTSSVPFEGFKALRGSNGPKKFSVEKWGDENSLPRAHTCFNRLDLPAYATKQMLLKKLRVAIAESSCYAIE